MTLRIRRRLAVMEGRITPKSWLKYQHRPAREWPIDALNDYLGELTDDELRELHQEAGISTSEAEEAIAEIRLSVSRRRERV